MSNSAGRIEITENTLLKLLIRRGSNTERANVILSEGELGYTVDTRRLFVGDGVTAGGSPTSLFLYFGTGHPSTWAAEAEAGDVAYDSIAGGIYRLNVKPYTVSGNWTLFSGPLANRVDDETLQLNATTGVMSVKTISAAQLDVELAGLGLEFNGTRELQTTANQEFDAIATRNNAYIQLPQAIQFGTAGGATVFNMPAFDGAQGSVVTTDGFGNLTLADPTANTRFLVLSSNIVPVGTIVQYGSGGNFNETSTTIPHGYFLCDGSTKDGTVYSALCAAIGQYYGGTGTSFNVPFLTAADYVFLIKYLEDIVFTQSILTLNTNTLTGYDATNSQSVSSLVFPNSGISYEIGVKNSSITTETLAPTSVTYDKILPWSGMPLQIVYTQTNATSTIPGASISDTWFSINTLSATIIRKAAPDSVVRVQGMVNIGYETGTYSVGMRVVRFTDADPTPTVFIQGRTNASNVQVIANAEGNNTYNYATVPIDCYDASPPSDQTLYYVVQLYSVAGTSIDVYLNRAGPTSASTNNYTTGVSSLTLTEIKS